MENATISLLTHPTVLTAVFVGAGVLILVYIIKLIRKDEDVVVQKTKNEIPSHSEKRKDATHSGKAKKKVADNRWTARNEKQAFSHPWLLTTLKGHTGSILDMDFSSNGKYLTSCGDDRAVFIWDTKDLTHKDRKSLRVNIEFDYATLVKWSPDSKAFIINKFNENAVEVYKVEKKKDGWLQASKALTFPKAHETDVIGMGIASNGRFIMTCSNKTDLVLWDLKGQKLTQIDTYLMNTTCAKISPCGRFVVATGFTPEARVWEVIFNKSGEFVEIKQVKQLTLSGHSSGVYDVAFDVDSSHMATVSKDGTWHLYDTKVNYKLGEDTRIIRSGKYEQASNNALIALSPDAEVIVIATFNTLSFYSTLTGQLDYAIENVFAGNITCLLFDSTGKYILVSGDKHIRVFHNVTGYRCNIQSAKEKLKESQTSATKERLQKLIVDSQAFLDSVEKK
ncbi:transducin beta-like protein 2 isoform X3 [Anoplophora glabripennis]|uniref:transducin beta-like protein 2 isoform X3 n=1 Tax=Anoplophora glabripennis TaxID=217634 RepID=UPI000874930D|nr:transducin beta-like protein 2 isoform X3 [Anoplophora glabripennis]